MATAEELRTEFTTFMHEHDVKYTIHDESDNIVRLQFAAHPEKGAGATDTTIFVDFDERGNDADSVHFVAWQFATCTEEHYAQTLVKINDLNAKFRWAKFWMKRTDTGGVITADADAKLVPGSSGLEVTSLAFTMSDIVENAIIELGDLIDTGSSGPSMEEIMALLQMLANRQN